MLPALLLLLLLSPSNFRVTLSILRVTQLGHFDATRVDVVVDDDFFFVLGSTLRLFFVAVNVNFVFGCRRDDALVFGVDLSRTRRYYVLLAVDIRHCRRSDVFVVDDRHWRQNIVFNDGRFSTLGLRMRRHCLQSCDRRLERNVSRGGRRLSIYSFRCCRCRR